LQLAQKKKVISYQLSVISYQLSVKAKKKKKWIPAFAGMTKKKRKEKNSCHSFLICAIRVLLFFVFTDY